MTPAATGHTLQITAVSAPMTYRKAAIAGPIRGFRTCRRMDGRLHGYMSRVRPGDANRPKKPRYDLRESWPWYERNCHTDGGHGTPPPFTLADIEQNPVRLSPFERKVAQAISISAAVALVVFVVWGLSR